MNQLKTLVGKEKAENIFDLLKSKKDFEWLLLQIIEDIENGKNYEECIKNIENNKIGWEHELFQIYKKRQDEYDEFVSNPFETEEGVVECINCKSKRVYSTLVQMRSSDEPMSLVALCTQCKTQWISNN